MEAIGQLTAGVAHDFNNLLTVILGNLNIAQATLEGQNLRRVQSKIELAQNGAQRAATLTQRLVAFSRRQNLEPQRVNVNKIVSEMTELIRHSLGAIELETVLAGELWDAVVDPNQLENALLNLAVNARDAMPEGGKVTIETATAHLDAAYAAANTEVNPGQYVLIAVSDGGTGMSPSQVAQAFEPFFTTKEIGKGSGLGLSQVFGFIKQSRGHVKIYSELGSGTTVKLYLPRLVAKPDTAAATAITTATAAAPPAVPRAGSQETILVVEDDTDVLAYSTEALESLGYKVVATKDASVALSALDTYPDIALLFTDVELPGLNGQELAREALRRRPGLAVVYTTGYPSNAIRHRELLDRAVKVISKPFALEELATTVRDAIEHPPSVGRDREE
ncbi:MAG: response regulator [Acetobacteraceae bacterium]|nr:response regulator [Acetobacteraceae bacterium]